MLTIEQHRFDQYFSQNLPRRSALPSDSALDHDWADHEHRGRH